MANNDYKKQNTDEMVKGLLETTIPMKIVSVTREITTTEFANKFVDVIQQTYGIKEIDHIAMYPVYGKTGAVEAFGMVGYFDTSITGNNGDIKRIGVGNNGPKRNEYGQINLMGAMGAKMSSGAYQLSPAFKTQIGALADLDNDGNIVTKEYPRDKAVALIDLDFYKVAQIAMGVTERDNFEVTIPAAIPVNTRDDCNDWRLIITKDIVKAGNRKRGKSGKNYDAYDRQLSRSRR